MGWPFLLGNATLFVAFVYLLLLRSQVEGLRAVEERRQVGRAEIGVPR